MSWILRYALDPDGCRCPGACDCADLADPQIAGALNDLYEATTPLHKRDAERVIDTPAPHLPSHEGRADQHQGSRPSSCRELEVRHGAQRKDTGNVRALRPTPNLQEATARDNTRPLTSAIGEVVPIRRTPSPSGPQAA